MSRQVPLFLSPVIFVLGLGVGVCAAPTLSPPWTPDHLDPYVVEGYVTGVNHNGTAAYVLPSREIGGILQPNVKTYFIEGTPWRWAGQGWSSSFPKCLEPDTSGQRVRLGVADLAESLEVGAGPLLSGWSALIENSRCRESTD
jgi:hypothetical protein